MTYFIKLSGIPRPASAETLSFKIKYERSQDPTPDNPLKGLFDYTGVAKSVRDHPSDRHALDSTLRDELSRQDILRGKYKFFNKPSEASSLSASAREGTPPRNRADALRLEGRMDDVEINHGHFLDHQKNSETGISNERLRWIVKLKVPPGNGQREAFERALRGPEVLQAIEGNVRAGLQRGDALELVNDANKRLLEHMLQVNQLPGVEVRLALQRPGLLPDTVVVVGENAALQPSPGAEVAAAAVKADKDPDRPRRYRDFHL